jgi:hypothetical protein
MKSVEPSGNELWPYDNGGVLPGEVRATLRMGADGQMEVSYPPYKPDVSVLGPDGTYEDWDDVPFGPLAADDDGLGGTECV